MKIVTFNLRFNNPEDGPYSFDNRKEEVIRRLREEMPDVVGFQEMRDGMQEFMEERGISTKQAIMITLSVDETCRIIAAQSGDLKLQITLVLEDNTCTVHLRDNASKFNPMEIDENSDEGLGLKIVRKKAKEYYYRQFVGFNILTLMFERQV